jgi:folate-binding protein YgfZ
MKPPDQMPAGSASQQAAPTPLCAALAQPGTLYCGALTPRVYDGLPEELDSLLHAAGVSDLGYRAKILVTGSDRLRWLNGMVSNTVQALPEGQGNYSFLLSVQGRIQGDCNVYRRADDLLLDTSLDQLPVLMSHLDHFIVMDDVELADVSGQWTALALTGPAAPRILATLGIALSNSNAAKAVLANTVQANAIPADATMTSARIGEVECILIEAYRVAVPRYELWFAPEHALAVWETLQAAGAHPCGLEAMEALRVLEATPLYGVDLNDRDLPQETAQARALNFNKGCYLGQEIVERIRSRGKVNRQSRQFALQGVQPAVPFDLRSGDQAVGRITSTASLAGAGVLKTLALGFIRLEVAERNAEITYEGGAATTLAAPPSLTRPLGSQP